MSQKESQKVTELYPKEREYALSFRFIFYQCQIFIIKSYLEISEDKINSSIVCPI